jgi:hypothetical protein
MLPRPAGVCKVDAPKKTKNLEAALLRHGQQPDLDEAGEEIVESVSVQVVAHPLADLGPRHAGVPSLGYQRHHPVGCWHMIVLPPISLMEPGVEVVDIHAIVIDQASFS